MIWGIIAFLAAELVRTFISEALIPWVRRHRAGKRAFCPYACQECGFWCVQVSGHDNLHCCPRGHEWN